MILRRDAEELASAAQGIGAQVIQGLVRHPGRQGGLDIGDVNIIEEPLWELKDQEVLLILAPLRPQPEHSTVCRLCRTPYEGVECPACASDREEAKKVAQERLLFDEGFAGLLGEN